MPIRDLKNHLNPRLNYIHYNKVLLFPLKHSRDTNRIYFQFSSKAQSKDIILNNLRNSIFPLTSPLYIISENSSTMQVT